MPLRAISAGRAVNSFSCAPEEWSELKRSYRALSLTMPCCKTPAIPKTSRYGSRFFAHASRGECSSAPESEKHILLKTLIAQAATDVGWHVETEAPGTSPDGEPWVADVLCVSGKRRVALEVQLASQTMDEFLQRQKRYDRSGVRCAWFVPKARWGWPHDPRLPVFEFESASKATPLEFECFGLPIQGFVRALLNKNVQWRHHAEECDVLFVADCCWKCGNLVKQVVGREFGVYAERGNTVPHLSIVLEQIQALIQSDTLRAMGLNTIGQHSIKGNAPRFPYCNECFHCGAPQTNCYVLERSRKVECERTSCEVTNKDAGRWCILAPYRKV